MLQIANNQLKFLTLEKDCAIFYQQQLAQKHHLLNLFLTQTIV